MTLADVTASCTGTVRHIEDDGGVPYVGVSLDKPRPKTISGEDIKTADGEGKFKCNQNSKTKTNATHGVFVQVTRVTKRDKVFMQVLPGCRTDAQRSRPTETVGTAEKNGRVGLRRVWRQ